MTDGVEQGDGNHHEQHGDGRQYQAQGQEAARIAAVADAGHDKLGEAIGYSIHCQGGTQHTLGEAEGLEHGNGHGEILSHQVEAGISDEDADKDLPTQSLVLGIGFGAGLFRLIGRGS